jgi:hypothetical protein
MQPSELRGSAWARLSRLAAPSPATGHRLSGRVGGLAVVRVADAGE